MDDKCHVILFNKDIVLDDTEHTQVITLHVTGMGCVNCANRVHNRLIDHPGVVVAEVSHITAKAEVTYIPTKVSVPQLLGLIAGAGDNRHMYRAVPLELGGAG